MAFNASLLKASPVISIRAKYLALNYSLMHSISQKGYPRQAMKTTTITIALLLLDLTMNISWMSNNLRRINLLRITATIVLPRRFLYYNERLYLLWLLTCSFHLLLKGNSLLAMLSTLIYQATHKASRTSAATTRSIAILECLQKSLANLW